MKKKIEQLCIYPFVSLGCKNINNNLDRILCTNIQTFENKKRC